MALAILGEVAGRSDPSGQPLQVAAEGSQPLAPTISAIDLASVRDHGAEQAARDALAHLQRAGGPACSAFPPAPPHMGRGTPAPSRKRPTNQPGT
jgi:hypothetical protein